MIGVVGDMHMKESLGYADYIPDRREGEKKEILDFIVKELSDCETIVFLGDQFDHKNNQSSVIKEFIQFLDRFNIKKQRLIFLSGNHEKKADGTTAIDFMKQIEKQHNWDVFTNSYADLKIKNLNLHFLPYTYKEELGEEDNIIASKKLMKMITEGDILFLHQAVSGTEVTAGLTTDLFNEIVLPKDKLKKKFKLIIGGHIHVPSNDGNVVVTGSVFRNEALETEKYIWKIDESDLSIKQIPLPGRNIYKMENPTMEVLEKTNKNNIVKAVFTEEISESKMNEIRAKLSEFDASIVLEQYPRERKKVHFENAMLEFNIVDLLKEYAKEKGINESDLIDGFNLIKI
jgi:DNA repair exonuclease SbcCD nuclease subunit